MALTPDDYEGQALALLPPGPAWPRSPEAPPGQLAAGWGYSLARLDAAVMNLIEEADPRTTYELLTDYERVAGLPDLCELAFGGEQESGQRRDALLARLTSVGGQTPAYIVAVAAAMGYDITITEFHEHTVDDDIDYPLTDEDWVFAFEVNALGTTVNDFTVDGNVDDPLAYWGNAILECVLDRIKPAHTIVVYSYTT